MRPAEVADWEQLKHSNDYLDCVNFIRAYPNTTKFDSVLQFYYEREEKLQLPAFDYFTNCANFTIDSLGTIRFQGQICVLDTLMPSLFHFIQNPTNKLTLPGKFTARDPQGKSRSYSKAAFILSYHPSQKNTLQRVSRSVTGAFYLYNSYLSQHWYKKDYRDLDSQHQYFLDSILKYRLRFVAYDKVIPTPPPPPLADSIQYGFRQNLSSIRKHS